VGCGIAWGRLIASFSVVEDVRLTTLDVTSEFVDTGTIMVTHRERMAFTLLDGGSIL